MPDPIQPDPHPAPGRLRRARAAALSWRAARPQAARARAGRIDWARVRKAWDATQAFLARHYVALVILGALAVSLGALLIGLWRVPLLVNALLDELQTNATDPDATRGAVVALAAVLAAITIIGTLIAQAIRVWTSERQTRTLEQGHVTDRLTRAIEQLGAEKTVKRIEKDAEGADIRDAEGRLRVVETTVPNLEVRLGAIYALERIAQDSERDHTTIMEILCAYIRENAKYSEAEKSPFGKNPLNKIGDFSIMSRDSREKILLKRSNEFTDWILKYPRPRLDVQAAITVIGRRPEPRRQMEAQSGFRLDLSLINLRRANLVRAHLERANLRNSRLEGVDLQDAHLEGADLTFADLSGSFFNGAHLNEAQLFGAGLEDAGLANAMLKGAHLAGARLHSAQLRREQLEGQTILGDLRDVRWVGEGS